MSLCLALQQATRYMLSCLAIALLCVTSLAQAPPAPAQPKITSVTLLHSDVVVQGTQNQSFIAEISGTGLNAAGFGVAIFPASNVTDFKASQPSATQWEIQFTAPTGYVLEEVDLVKSDSGPILFKVGQGACDLETKFQRTFSVVPNGQAKNKYGNGVAKNFHVIQISLVNECAQSVVVPLAGIRLLPQPVPIATISAAANKVTVTTASANPFQTGELIEISGVTNSTYNGTFQITVTGSTTFEYSLAGAGGPAAGGAAGVSDTQQKGSIVPYSLDHVTSVYSTDRKLTGTRAIFFNSLQAAAAVGSAIEVFFGHGFTQGVSILGGGFTTAAQDVLKDMSTDQLQNLTSQSFGSTEQVAANGGPLQKFIFVRKGKKNKTVPGGVSEDDLKKGNFRLVLEIIPVPSQTVAATVKASSAPQ